MSTHWKQNTFVIIVTCSLLVVLGFILFLCLPLSPDIAIKQTTLLMSTTDHTNDSTTNPTTTIYFPLEPFLPSSTESSATFLESSLASQLSPSSSLTTEHNAKSKSNWTENNVSQTFDSIEHSYTTANQSFDEIDENDWSEEEELDNNERKFNPADKMSDYVIPIKVDNFSLNADDLLYESKRYLNNGPQNNAFSVTGTFRSKSSQIWDPHPEYILNTFGHSLHLILHQDTSFIPSKTFRVINIINNRSEEADNEEDGGEPTHYLGCFYKGHIEGDEQSAVAVSLCHGMHGYIKTSFGTLLIQPANKTWDNATSSADILHKVWRQSRRNARYAVDSLELELKQEDSEQMSLDMDSIMENSSRLPRLRRQKRHYHDDRHLFTIELLVAVDRTMKEFHKSDLTPYILTLISIVSNIFADASIGNSIYISVANILVLHEYKRSRRRGGGPTTASQSLKDFCAHVAKNGYHYDTAMLITRDQICRKERETKCDTLGLAELGTVCRRSSCSIVQDNGLPAAFTIAHELGHILNIPHDDDDRCKQFNRPGVKPTLHIMSSVMGDDIHPWSWSDCSRYHVSEFLEKEDKSCLEDTPTKFIRNYNTRLPGEIYSLDHQCKLIHGEQSRYCHIEVDCKRLWCKTHGNNSDCRSSNLPWADGTPCSDNRHWCHKGECVPREGHTPLVVNGGWGPWTPFTPCSLTCGGGVQESQRECNNPLPKSGGKYCAGARKKYRSCNTQNCPVGSMDAREQQCYQMNGRDFGINGIGPQTKWIPKYGLPSKDKCNLYCRAEGNTGYFRLSEKVIDGTTCSFDSFDKCVNGICRPAGCDNELNSLAKLDKCGICEGRNDTCEKLTGNFYVSDLYRVQPKHKTYYYHVTTIPKGASNIVIEQPGYNAENYIVLRDEQGKSLLNGDNVIIPFHNVSFYAGVAYEYNGSGSPIERVNTTYTRKLKRDLIVEIISMITNSQKDNNTLLMTYSYTMDKSNLEPEIEIYRWEMQQWSTCDTICHGSMHRLPVCISSTLNLKVASQFCDQQSKPPVEYRNCNTDCVLTLNVSSITDCSASCGQLGSREKTFHCIQTFTEINRSNIVDIKYCALQYELNPYEECREGCWQYQEWTACSKTCGSGIQTRAVGCYFNKSFVHEDYCNSNTKNNYRDTIRICQLESCSRVSESMKISRAVNNFVTTSSWWTGDWGPCDDNCERNRTVRCRSLHGHAACPADRRPLSKRKCCVIKYVSNWSDCSVQCGIGVRRKELHCARVYKPEIKGTPRRREFIDPKYCQHLRLPKMRRTQKPCKTTCKWSVSNWSQCPSDCSGDYQSRSVYCESVDGNLINQTYCEDTKRPISRKICHHCIQREYKFLTNCNCDGYRRRRILCYDSQKRRVLCPTKEKISREKCAPPRHCYPSSCYDLRRYHHIRIDGEYTLYIRSTPKRIYCHDMVNSPKEFLTLNSTENYSIYYDNKTYNPDQCPPKSRNREYRDVSLRSGRTTFRRIRFDVVTLRVYDNDFTFTETVGAPQPYGSAGDCYNRQRRCPQGDFSINLENTGFRLKHGTIWEPYGHHVVMKESSFNSYLVHRALCGGWCGGCRIAANSALYLDV